MSDKLPILSSSFAGLPVPGYNQGVSSPYSRTANELMRGLSYDLSQDVVDAGNRVAQALLAPVRAARGEYDQVSIYPNGYVSPIDERLISDAADFSGLVSVGAMPIPRPIGSLGMGSAKISPDPIPEGFPIQKGQPFPWLHNTEGAFQYVRNDKSITKMDPAGRFVVHDDLGRGRGPDERWISGQSTFENPLYIQVNGWKERLNETYGGKSGKALSDALKKDGYDGIVTFDKYGPSEIININDIKPRGGR